MSREYKQPETRIKHVVDRKGERYYAQVKINWFWGWENLPAALSPREHTRTLKEAKERMDSFLVRHYYKWESSENLRKKVKFKTEYIEYP